MAKSAKALINPRMLVWARESSGLTLDAAAKKLSKNLEILEQWESGDKAPTFKQLLTIAKTYKRPVPLFYMTEPPKNFKPLHDYRRLPGIAPVNESPQLNYEIRRAYYRRQVALDLFEELGESIPKFTRKITLSDNPEDTGARLREWLGIDNTRQTRWKTDNEAFNGWRQTIEALGILVFQAERIDVSEMRGFAIGDRPLPVIVVNKKDTHKGRIFSMLHELAHILLGDSSISGDVMAEKGLPPEEKKVEVFCNHVAASTLLPSAWFSTDELLAQFPTTRDWTDETVYAAAQRFNVSREFIWRRLLSMQFINQQTYRQKRDALIEEFRARKEQEEKKSIPVPHHRKVISSIGRFYAELVLSGYHQEKINSSTVSEYLGMKLKHLPKVESALFEKRLCLC